MNLKFSRGMLYSMQGGEIKHLNDLPLLRRKWVLIFFIRDCYILDDFKFYPSNIPLIVYFNKGLDSSDLIFESDLNLIYKYIELYFAIESGFLLLFTFVVF